MLFGILQFLSDEPVAAIFRDGSQDLNSDSETIWSTAGDGPNCDFETLIITGQNCLFVKNNIGIASSKVPTVGNRISESASIVGLLATDVSRTAAAAVLAIAVGTWAGYAISRRRPFLFRTNFYHAVTCSKRLRMIDSLLGLVIL